MFASIVAVPVTAPKKNTGEPSVEAVLPLTSIPPVTPENAVKLEPPLSPDAVFPLTVMPEDALPVQLRLTSAPPLFVATWGRRDWQPAPATRYVPGVTHDLALVPVRDRIDLERTCFADNVGLKGELYWADSITDAP